MGVRLVKYGINNGAGIYNHDELKNRELPAQHPIEAIAGLSESLNAINVKIEETAGIDSVVDTKSINFEYDTVAKSLTGNVKIFDSKDNALVEKISGLYVDKYLDLEIENTDTVSLTVEGKGETLKTMYDTGTRFSHYNTWDNVYNQEDANDWYYSDALQSFVQPTNTSSFTGFISTVKYRTYTHRATLKSSHSDNDGIGLIIAYAVDEAGNPHTLSVVINKGGEGHVGNYYYALVYDKNLPDEEILFIKGNKTGGTIPGNHSTSGWSNQTITVEVNKSGAIVTCATSNYESANININTLIEIDLDNYAWGYLFRNKVQYGYCAQSQPSSFFQNIYFDGKGPLKANVILSPDPENAIIERPDGLFISNENLTGNSSQVNVFQTNHNLSVGDVVYNTLEGYKKGIASETSSVEIIGIVSVVKDVDNFKLCTSGFLETDIFDSYENGTVLFLSDVTEGAMIVKEPYISKPIATKVANGIIVNIQRGIVYSSEEGSGTVIYKTEDKIGDIKYSVDSTPIRLDGYVLFKNDQSYNKAQVQELLNIVSQDFIESYITITSDLITFKNTESLTNSVYYDTIDGNLYIKAFQSTTDNLIEIPVGNIVTTLDAMPPTYYMHLDGRECMIIDYPVLASYIYNTYGSYVYFGGDGLSTFGLPNLNTSVTDVNGNIIQMYYYIKYC